MEWTELVIGVIVLIIGLYYWSTSTFDFWTSRGIVGPAPAPLIGNLKTNLLGRMSFGEYIKSLYDEYRDERMFGIFMRKQPFLVLIDPDLIKDVLIKDFSTWSDRGLKYFPRAEPLSQHLVNLEPSKWRPLRHKLSPTFSSGKLKQMFYLILDCGGHLEKFLEKVVARKEPVECREMTSKFTTDVIGSCAFGLQFDALTDEDSEFHKMGKNIFQPDWKKSLRFRIREFAPALYSLLGPLLVDWNIVNFFSNVMRDTMTRRQNTGMVRHDFIDLLMEMRKSTEKLGDNEMTDEFITAQLFVFFLAGFETSSTTMSNALYELAINQEIQDKLREEIREEMTKNNGELTYEGIKSMTYLHKIFQETLRLYPPATVLIRRSMNDYTFAGTNLTLPEDSRLIIPVFGIHRDSRVYPKPDVFDPERFSEEAIASRHPMSWIPFGDGPRNCIAARFANYVTKVGIIKILHKYKVEVCEKTRIPYVFHTRSMLLAPVDGIHVKISKIDC